MEALLGTLWKISWQTAILAAIVFVVTRLARKAPASWRYGLWLIVLVKFLVPPFAQVPGEWVKWQRSAPQAVTATNTAPPEAAPSNGAIYPPPASVHSRVPAPAAVFQPDAKPVRPLDLLPILWIAGACVMAGLLVVRFVKQVMVVRRSSHAPDEVSSLLAECARQLGVNRCPSIGFSNTAQTPMLVGLLRPTILLPPAIMDSCGSDDLRAILLHELAHVKRLDMAALWLEQLVKVVFFFNPALWLASREIRRERELACDEMVLSKSSIGRESYASGYVAALKMANRVSVLATSLAMAEPLDLEKRRLQMIMRSQVTRLTSAWVVALAVVAVLGLPTFSGMLRTPTAADIANALKQQEAACGASLEVTFDQEFGQSRERLSFRSRYIRTPDKLIKDGTESGGWNVKYAYDRDTGRVRKLITYPEGYFKHSGRYQGLISGFFDTPFDDQDFMETSRYALFDGALSDVIDRGVVSKTMESIDGFMCYRVEIPPSRVGTHNKFVVWVDPNIGYCPRLIHIVWTGSPVEVISFKNYEEVAKGVWFPTKMTVDAETDGKHIEVTDTAVAVQVGRVIPKDKLEVEFPVGTEVHIFEGGKYRTYIEPEKGSANNASDLLAGVNVVYGPGVAVTLSDSTKLNKKETRKDVIANYLVHDGDIKRVVNELFAAGAEAVSVNNQRIVATTAINCAGPMIMVNSVRITHPYTIRAIGNPDELARALSAKGGPAETLFLLDMIKVEKLQSITIPAYTGKTSFEYAKPVN